MCCYPNYKAACKCVGLKSVCPAYEAHVNTFPREKRYLILDRAEHGLAPLLLLVCGEYIQHFAKHLSTQSCEIVLVCPRKGALDLAQLIGRKLVNLLETQGVNSQLEVGTYNYPILKALTSTVHIISVDKLSDIVKKKNSVSPRIVLCYELGFIAQYSKAARNAVSTLVNGSEVLSTAILNFRDAELLDLPQAVQKWILDLYNIDIASPMES